MRGDDDRIEKGFGESIAGGIHSRRFVEPGTCLHRQTKQSRVDAWVVAHASRVLAIASRDRGLLYRAQRLGHRHF